MATKEAGTTRGQANNTNTIAREVNMHHLALGSPTHTTFFRAIEKGWLTGFPNLTLENAKLHCTKKTQTILGHQKLIRQNTKSTKDPTPRTNCHRLGIGTVTDKELRNLVCIDQLGRYPITSARGNKCVLIVHDYDSAYINAIPMKARKSHKLVRAFELGYKELTDAGLTGQVMRLDNEISNDLIAAIKEQDLKYQLVSPGDHRQNLAERAIQTWKAHFISIRNGTDPSFP
jgi:hypothetical protein